MTDNANMAKTDDTLSKCIKAEGNPPNCNGQGADGCPVRVLHVVAALDRGGVETMLLNHYRKIDRRLVQFDFMVNYPHRGAYEDEVEALGAHVYHMMPIRPWTYHRYFAMLDAFFADHPGYVAVHAHIQDNSGFVLKYAARHGINTRIAHSHLGALSFDFKYPFYLFARRYLRRYVTDRWACGEAAGRFMFGRQEFTIFRNAIDVASFAPDSDVRHAVRSELGIGPDTLVVGHVGRFFKQKNHPFLLRIFARLQSRRPDSRLMLCGNGEDLEAMRALARQLGIDDKVMFLGVRPDVARLLQAMDVMAFPSLFEGLPVSIIEAQAAGLPCVLSDTIDAETAITPLVRFVPLTVPVDDWVDAVFEAAKTVRIDTQPMLASAGYDVQTNARRLTDFYLGKRR